MLLLLPNKPKKQYYHHQGNIFGTYYNIRYEGTEDLHDAIKQCLQDFDHSLSMFNPNSVISKVNRNENVVALPQRRVVWMWFGAFPGAFGLGRAQPQRRGSSP